MKHYILNLFNFLSNKAPIKFLSLFNIYNFYLGSIIKFKIKTLSSEQEHEYHITLKNSPAAGLR